MKLCLLLNVLPTVVPSDIIRPVTKLQIGTALAEDMQLLSRRNDHTQLV